jgi:chaperonin GroES
MQLKPLYDRVVVRRAEEEQVTSGGIIIPGTASEKPSRGEVIAVGNGVRDNNGELQALDVTVGNIVLFNKHAGTEVNVDNEDFVIMHEEEIVAVIN